RLGDEVVERLIDPLVGGINAGDVDHLSLAATVPQLDAAVRSGAGSVVEACRAQRARVADPDAPVFFAPRGGMGALAQATWRDAEARGVVLVSAAAVGVERRGVRWAVSLDCGGPLEADAVVIAAPAGVAARL